MAVFEVLDDGDRVVGTLTAPDADLALLLARETFFRRDDGPYAIRARGTETLRRAAARQPGATDRSYRRPDGYVGVGRKFTRIRAALRERGIAPVRRER